ncbi:PD-(D/E)XK nuclease family protein [Austwickia sp. TVS 96-490-7B]|uniref:RecB family exonuclease n=1 Tax=Austwickia sp. TVS 96-490-7B TaxID=2830843 RepID=UPI001C5998F2|nr:PD-(D/E)XK nuclease family protein [Austwickia sp. TVS 96-490-7B]
MAPALSPSRASDFMQCPLLYRFRVVDKLPEPASAAAARGTLVHAVLERLFDLPAPCRTLEEAVSLVPAEWDRLVTERPELAALVTAQTPAGSVLANDGGSSETADEAEALRAWFDAAERLVQRWFTLEDPTRLEPAERELYVESDLDGLTLRGYVDRLDVAPDGRMRVVDYKTGRAPSEVFQGKALFQMKFYALVLWRLRGRIPTLLQLVYLGSGEIVRYEPEEADLLAVERKIKALWSAIERAAITGDFRSSPSKLCHWCDHRSLCPSWGGTPPPLPEAAAMLIGGGAQPARS